MPTVPSGDWYCPGCDMLFSYSVEELRDDAVPSYHQGDPYVDNVLLTYVRSGHDQSVLQALVPERLRPYISTRAVGSSRTLSFQIRCWCTVLCTNRALRAQGARMLGSPALPWLT